jgi:hypothetical protein
MNPQTTIPTKGDYDRPFLTPKQLAARWACSLMKLRRMRRAGVLQVYYIGRAARYALTDILKIESDSRA